MVEDSPLSSPVSVNYASDFSDGDAPRVVRHSSARNGAMPPSKRLKLSAVADDFQPATSPEAEATGTLEEPPLSPISSDTSGDIPNSPRMRAEEEEPTQEQVTYCNWDGCSAGDLGNMDRLVNHIHDFHVEMRNATEGGKGDGRVKKYTCEWEDCSRKGMAHASAYALKAHMRSHTREKPFYCVVPECDRAFTRSDALQKHMRTVHDTEAFRNTDLASKSEKSSKKAPIKLILKTAGSTTDAATVNAQSDDGLTPFPADMQFTEEELKMSPHEMWRLLRRQVHWAEEEADELKREIEVIEAIRRKEWLEKEILLDQVAKSELDWHERRQVVLAAESARLAAVAEGQKDELEQAGDEVLESHEGDGKGDDVDVDDIADTQEHDDEQEEEEEAAAVLASLHNA